MLPCVDSEKMRLAFCAASCEAKRASFVLCGGVGGVACVTNCVVLGCDHEAGGWTNGMTFPFLYNPGGDEADRGMDSR